MVSRTLVILTDDLNGGEADETVKFALDGVQYEIDLAGGSAKQIRALLAPYIGAGRRIGKMDMRPIGRAPIPRQREPQDAWLERAARISSNGVDGTTKADRTAIREWAAGHGVSVAERGRIKEEVVKAWRAKDPTLMGVDAAPEPPAPVKHVPTPPRKAAVKRAVKPVVSPAARKGNGRGSASASFKAAS